MINKIHVDLREYSNEILSLRITNFQLEKFNWDVHQIELFKTESPSFVVEDNSNYLSSF